MEEMVQNKGAAESAIMKRDWMAVNITDDAIKETIAFQFSIHAGQTDPLNVGFSTIPTSLTFCVHNDKLRTWSLRKVWNAVRSRLLWKLVMTLDHRLAHPDHPADVSPF